MYYTVALKQDTAKGRETIDSFRMFSLFPPASGQNLIIIHSFIV